MPQADVYADIVDLYDLEHNDFFDDIELLLELAALGDRPILELGSGTGRVLGPLAEAGYTVVGLDSSAPMLDVAGNRVSGSNITLLQGDMAELDGTQGAPFGMVIASLNSIMHLNNPEDQRSMIESAWRVLAPEGRLIIDTLNPSLGQLNHLLNTTHLEGSWSTPDGTTVDKWSFRRFSDEPQVIDTLIWYDQLDADGRLQRVRTRFDLRYLHQSELALMLELAGFGHVDWYGSYELDSWDPDSDRIIAIAHKDSE